MDYRTQEPPLLRDIRSALMACRGKWGDIQAQSGVPMSTISKVAYGVTTDPGIKTVEALRAWLRIRAK
jgi:hypothetical protein